MYKCNIPDVVCRDAFVDMIFDIGEDYEVGYDTMVNAVKIGDDFMYSTYKKQRFVLYNKDIKKMYKTFHENENEMIQFNSDHPCIKYVDKNYSIELAIVCIVISSKLNEENCTLQTIYFAERYTLNSYVIKLEWEIYLSIWKIMALENFVSNMTNINPSYIREYCKSNILYTK